MSESMRIGLDNPIFEGRLRTPLVNSSPSQASAIPDAQTLHQALPQRAAEESSMPAPQRHQAESPNIAELFLEKHRAASMPKKVRLRNAFTRLGRYIRQHAHPPLKVSELRGYSRVQWALMAGAGLVFAAGIFVSLQGFLANHKVTAQVSALSKKADQSSGGSNPATPSTTKPSSGAFNAYMVAPDLPRYIKIPKLGVNARVLQAGVTSSGALSAPANVYDSSWYTGSAKPGQPGAALIDGHVSSWTTHGVFYGLKKLVAGDTIQIQRGDGQLLTYRVVKTQAYADDKVDMQAAMTPVTAGKSGLNLITCTGQVKKGTSEFNQRLVVFTEQI
jgi:LPXTG-site transpeptidase (sortase) family protein